MEIVSKRRLDQISKFLSFVLRHKPEAIGLGLDAQGWASVSEIIEKGSVELPLTAELIRQVVTTNDKQRFSLSEDGERIRANQGHSTDIDLGLEPKEPPPVLYHGTATRFLSLILKDGLHSGKRHHVHLSINTVLAMRVGQRHGKPIVLGVDAITMYQQGYPFFLSENGIWLTNSVPAKFLSVLR